MKRPKLKFVSQIVNEPPNVKQMELKTFTIIYKIACFYRSWNKCKCVMNVEHATYFQ
jgi:hypothetical protein